MKKIKNYKSLLSVMKKNKKWHFNPQKKSKDVFYVGRFNFTKDTINKIKKSVNQIKLQSCISIFKEDEKDYKKAIIAWTKMDSLQRGYNSSNTQMKQIIFNDQNKMPIWVKKIIKKSSLKKAYLSINMNPPGSINPWHFDSYQKIKNKYKLLKNEKIVRFLVFVKPWHWGHFSQVGNNVITHWKSGDCYTWDFQKYHLASNSGIVNRYTISITGITNKKLKDLKIKK